MTHERQSERREAGKQGRAGSEAARARGAGMGTTAGLHAALDVFEVGLERARHTLRLVRVAAPEQRVHLAGAGEAISAVEEGEREAHRASVLHESLLHLRQLVVGVERRDTQREG